MWVELFNDGHSHHNNFSLRKCQYRKSTGEHKSKSFREREKKRRRSAPNEQQKKKYPIEKKDVESNSKIYRYEEYWRANKNTRAVK